MPRLTFNISESDGMPYVEPLVDGHPLSDLVNETCGSTPSFLESGLPYPGSDYKIDDTAFGPTAIAAGRTYAILFACGCGFSACSAVVVDVSTSADTITFRNFRLDNERGYGLAPLSFARDEFQLAINDLNARIAKWTPAPPPPPLPSKPPIQLPGKTSSA